MKKLIYTGVLGILISGNLAAAIITKQITGTDLSAGASWVDGAAPGSTDVATWSGSSFGGTLPLGANTSWQGITVTGASADVSITGTSQTLTLGTAGVTVSGTRNLSIRNSGSNAANNLNVALAGNQTWSIASGLIFLVQGQQGGPNSAATFDLGGFTLTKTNAGAVHLFGSIVSNGTVNVEAGEFRLSAGSSTNANYTNTLIVNVAPTAKLLVAKNTGGATLLNQVNNLYGGTLDYIGATPTSLATVNFGTGTNSMISFGEGTTSAQVSAIGSLGGSGNFSIVDGTGAGTTLTLTGLNSGFTGNVTISTGQALNLADNAGLKFVIGANGINNSISGDGAATLAGDFTFDLTGASTSPGSSWQIVSNSTLTETFNSSFTVVGFTDNLNNTWTSADGVYQFSEITGALTVTAVPEPSLVLFSVIGGCLFYRRRLAGNTPAENSQRESAC